MKLLILVCAVSLLQTSAFASKSTNLSSKISNLFKVAPPSLKEYRKLQQSTGTGGGITVGNGGNLLVCAREFDQQLGKHELLDLIEGANLKDYTYQKLQNLNYDEVLTELKRRLNVLIPYQYQTSYQPKFRKVISYNPHPQSLSWVVDAEIDTFFDRALFLNRGNLSLMNDTGITIIPEGCELKQLAVQKIDGDFDGKNYYIDQKWWDKISDLSKAALVLHEIFVKKYTLQGYRTTEHARALVASIFSDQFLEMEKEILSLNLLNLDFREIQGIKFFYHHNLFKVSFLGMSVTIPPNSFSIKDKSGEIIETMEFIVDPMESLNVSTYGHVQFFTKRVQTYRFTHGQPKSPHIIVKSKGIEADETTYITHQLSGFGHVKSENFNLSFARAEFYPHKENKITNMDLSLKRASYYIYDFNNFSGHFDLNITEATRVFPEANGKISVIANRKYRYFSETPLALKRCDWLQLVEDCVDFNYASSSFE